MKAIEILKAQAVKSEKVIEHEALQAVLDLVKACLPELAASADEPLVRQLAGVALLIEPVVDAKLEALIASV